MGTNNDLFWRSVGANAYQQRVPTMGTNNGYQQQMPTEQEHQQVPINLLIKHKQLVK